MTTTRLKEAGWADVIDSAVILFGPHDTHVYEYEEFVKGAQEAEVGGNVVTLGPILKNITHYMGVDTTACRETLINQPRLDRHKRPSLSRAVRGRHEVHGSHSLVPPVYPRQRYRCSDGR